MPTTHADRLADALTQQLVRLLQSLSIQQLASAFPEVQKLLDSESAPPLRAARTTDEVVRCTAALLAEHPEGLRSEEMQTSLGVHPARMRLAIIDLVRAGTVVRRGRARGVRYFLCDGSSAGAPTAVPRVEVPADVLDELLVTLRSASVPLTAAGISARQGRTKELLRAGLEQLADAGLVLRLGAGRYRAGVPAERPSGTVDRVDVVEVAGRHQATGT